jgi:hypothetical protein
MAGNGRTLAPIDGRVRAPHMQAHSPHVYAGAHARSVDELYDMLQFTYPASIGRIRKGVELDQSLHAHLQELCPADVLDIEPEHQFAELLRKLSSYIDESSGAALWMIASPMNRYCIKTIR